MKKLITPLLILLCIQISSAQNYIDILKLNLNTTPLNQFDSSTQSTRVKEIGADLTLPIKINDKLAILTGLTYENIQSNVFENQSSISVSSINLKIGVNKSIAQHWTASFIFLPKISSDFKVIGKNDFQFGGIALFKYLKREDFNYKFALYYNSENFGPIIVPMFGMYYISTNKKWETNLMLPLQADINYKISEKIRLGLNFNGQIRTYHLTNVNQLNNSTYLSRNSNELCTYLKFNFTKAISLQTKLGYSLGRSYRVYDENDKVKFALPLYYFNDNRKQLNTDFADGMLMQIQMIYRVEIK